MNPAARVAAAIEVLDTWMAGGEGLDRVLASWGRGHRFAGSGDRRAIADLAYGAVRRRRSASWVARGSEDTARDVVRGALLLDGADVEDLFDGSRHGPARLSCDEPGVGRELASAPTAVALDYPDWMGAALEGVGAADLAALRLRAPLDLRVNALKADMATAVSTLAAEGVAVERQGLAPFALRVTSGATRIAQCRAYRTGLVEIQDVASQAVAAMAAPQPGERVLDLCAGAGGKTLAMAAHMAGQGAMDAHDIAPHRMRELLVRAERAGAAVRLVASQDLPAATQSYDLVMVDAPCSGSGAWRRNPDAKWRLTADRLAELQTVQADLMDQAAGLVTPGGRLAYVTCSLLASENAAQAKAFEARYPDWRALASRQFRLSDGGDGFYTALYERP
ncbi:MAG: RsmB/NOP family class I SAM-dependent RNA methyltransferase [Pseudomonadota bacterium]